MTEIIEHQYVLEITKVRKVPDRRFKSGYREVAAIARNGFVLQPNTQTSVNMSHLDKRKSGFHQTSVVGSIALNVEEFEQIL